MVLWNTKVTYNENMTILCFRYIKEMAKYYEYILCIKTAKFKTSLGLPLLELRPEVKASIGIIEKSILK